MSHYETIKAERLHPGDVIGVCSPSAVALRERLAPSLENLRAAGYRVKEAENLYAATDGYLATPEERAADLMQLVHDDEVSMIFFGGGEGANELLPLLDFEAIRKHPKLIASYSDATTLLNAIWAQTGLETYYGQSPRTFAGERQAYELWHFEHHLIMGDAVEHIPSGPWLTQWPGTAEGILVGGYARNFAMLLGSRYFSWNPEARYLLFLEDHEMFGDVSYVSAMLSHIEQSDFMQAVAGVLFGHYSPQPNPQLLARLQRLGRRWRIPVVYCDDFGHGERQAILPIGRHARLDANQGGLRYIEPQSP